MIAVLDGTDRILLGTKRDMTRRTLKQEGTDHTTNLTTRESLP